MQDISWACFVVPSLEWQMISSAVLGKPCQWTAPGSSPPTNAGESWSPGLERVPGGGGGGGGVAGQTESTERKDPVLMESRETPALLSLGSARAWGPPSSRCVLGSFLNSGEAPDKCMRSTPGRADLGLAGSQGLGWPPILAWPVRLGREQGSDFGWMKQRLQKQ